MAAFPLNFLFSVPDNCYICEEAKGALNRPITTQTPTLHEIRASVRFLLSLDAATPVWPISNELFDIIC